jgi:hypothetical protein
MATSNNDMFFDSMKTGASATVTDNILGNKG